MESRYTCDFDMLNKYINLSVQKIYIKKITIL